VTNILDLGSGDGRLLTIIGLVHPHPRAVARDFSETMIERLQSHFRDNPLVKVVLHDLNAPLPHLDMMFDAVVSSFAIHHLAHARKRSLYEEVFDRPAPGGAFCNLEHVASAIASLHDQYLEKLGIAPGQEDPSNKLLDVETQLSWLREIGFVDVDCHWKWTELALLAGMTPST
jgi:tRNA (cmo5U34)-methyltransferase